MKVRNITEARQFLTLTSESTKCLTFSEREINNLYDGKILIPQLLMSMCVNIFVDMYYSCCDESKIIVYVCVRGV